jgi:hypothetical protein
MRPSIVVGAFAHKSEKQDLPRNTRNTRKEKLVSVAGLTGSDHVLSSKSFFIFRVFRVFRGHSSLQGKLSMVESRE